MSFNEQKRIFDTEFRVWEIDLSRLVPIDSRVLIKRIEPKEVIVLTDKTPSHRGEVVRTGQGRRLADGSVLPLDVKPGQVVCYQSCDVDNGTHVLIDEADILFIES